MATDPIIDRLSQQIRELETRLTQFIATSARSEWTGGFSRVLYADLPAPGMRGRHYYCLNARIGAEPPGGGTGCTIVDNGNDWVYAHDPTAEVVI